MFTSAELIEVLRRRRRRSIRPEAAPDGFPPGWAEWCAGMQVRARAVTGATAAAIVAVLTARPPPGRRRIVGPRTRLQAWMSLAYPLWEPRARDERGLRRWSLAGTLLAQLLWVGLLTVLMQARFLVGEAPALGQEHVVQAVFIGDGTPADTGGGDAGQPSSGPAPVATPPSRDPAPTPAAPGSPVPIQPDASPDESVAAQVLQVTQTPMPDIDFTLPPSRPREALPEVVVREREVTGAPVQSVEVPRLRAPDAVSLPAGTPSPRQVQVEIRERAMPQVSDAPSTLEVTRREVVLDTPAAPVRSAPEIAAREREVPLRAPAPQAGASSASGTTPATASAPSPVPAPGRGAETPSPLAGRGPSPDALSGSTPSTRAADDWGDGAHAQAGGQRGHPSGLLGADGRPRLADGGRVGGGLPPGTITEDFARIDREGTWLRRPPTGYEPTSFDRFWVPSETLLEEWVRRSIKTVLIPIPGTSKTIQCNVALLAFGGGCGITDPNMQDVETDGRPPPDVPWKPELQEDQDSLGD